MWIKVTYAFDDSKEVYINMNNAWRVKRVKHGSTIYFNNLSKDDREITVKETPAELFKLTQI